MVGGTALAAQPEQGFSARPPLPLTAARRSLRLLGAAALALLLAVAAAYAWQTRRMQIEASSATAQRRVDRLAEALTQALALGELAISQVETLVAALPQGRSLAEALAHAGQDRQQLLRALPLPFDVQACDARGCPMGGPGGGQGLPAAATLPTDAPGWTVQLPGAKLAAAERRLVLLRPAAANAHGITAYAIELQHSALVARLESDRQLPGGGVALFRVEPDDSGITLLARAPFVEGELGKRLRGPLFMAVRQSPTGWFDDQTQVDGHRRVVAYQRLGGAASPLLLAYGLRTDDVLVAWRASLPWQAGTTLLALAMAVLGLVWLDRVLRRAQTATLAVQRSEAQLRALTDNLPDVVVRYDRAHRCRFANPAIETATGLKPAEVIGKTPAELGLPRAQVADWTLALDRVLAHGRPERLEFEYPGPAGPRHWESLVVPEQAVQGQVPSVLVISRDISERVQHAAALARSELRFRLAASYGQVWEWDVLTQRLQFPAVWWAGLGHPVPPAEQTLAVFEAILHPDDLARWRQVLREHLRLQRPYELLFRVATAAGGWRWMQSQGQSTRDAHGRAEYMAGTTFDVTDRQLAQQALRDNQQRLSDLLANSPAVIYTAQASGDFDATYYTPNVLDMLGHAAHRFTGEPGFWLNHVHPDDRSAILARLALLPAQGHLVLEYRFQRSDGQWRWLHDDVRLTRDDSGQPLELIGSLVDVTDRHTAEEDVRRLNAELEIRVSLRTAELQTSERRLRAIFDTVPVALNEEDWSGVRSRLQDLRNRGVADGPGYFAEHPDFVRSCLQSVLVLRINQRSAALQRLPVGIEGHFSLDLALQGDAGLAAFADKLAALWAGQRLYTCKRAQTTADGSLLQLMLTMALPAMDAATDGVALVCLVDITEIDRLNAELDATVARLKRINRELETFSYSVSHDLKAPLRGIDGYSQLLLRDHAAALDEEGRSFLGRIRAATQQMGQLIDDLLAYSRLDRRSLAMAALPLHRLVQQALDDAGAVARMQGAVLRNQVAPGLRALGDAQGLRMALRNLVDNALKFGRPGVPVELVVTGTLCATQSGDVVRLAVRDNGIGFDMKFHDRIFGIFQRLHRAELYPGTGVGLAIVRKAMDRMGGQVDAFSEPGQGAVFNLDLPVA